MSSSRYAPLLIKQVVQSKTCNKSIWNFLSMCVTSIATIAWDFSNYRKIGQSFDRGESFLLDFWLGCECSPAESYIFRSIHLEVFRKIASLKGFSKFLEKFDGVLFKQVTGLKRDSLIGFTLWGCCFWSFLNSCIENCLECFDTPALPHSNQIFTTT